MYNIPLEVYYLNKKLSRSIQKNAWFYGIIIGILSLSLIFTFIADFFIGSGNRVSFVSIVFMVVFFDVVVIVLRFQSRSFIEPHQLALFPINKWEKFLFYMAIFIMDYKTLIYLSVMGCFMLLFFQYSLYIAAIMSMFFWFILFFTVVTWTAAIYSLFGKYLEKMENKAQYIGLFFVAVLLGIQQFDSIFFEKLPIIKQTGDALYGLWISNPKLVSHNFQILLGSLVLPLLLLIGISKINRRL